MAVRDDRSDVKQTTTGFRGPLMVQARTPSISFIRIIFIFLACLLCVSGCTGGGTSGGESSSYAGLYEGRVTLAVSGSGIDASDSVNARVSVQKRFDGDEVTEVLLGWSSLPYDIYRNGCKSAIGSYNWFRDEKIRSNEVTDSGNLSCTDIDGVGNCTGPWDGKFVFSSSGVSLTFNVRFTCPNVIFTGRYTGFLPNLTKDSVNY